MTWVAWRQQRLETMIGVAFIALLAVLFVPVGLHMSDVFDDDRIGACLAAAGGGCDATIARFEDRFAAISDATGYFALIPVVIAIVFAAPLVLELERGTYLLAWTQSISRRRWTATKLTMSLGGAALCATLFAVLMTWWRRPIDEINGRIEPTTFQLEGIAPIAYSVFAAALIVVFGVLARRTIVAIVLATVTFLVARAVVESGIRPHFQAPVHAASPPADSAWVLDRAAGTFHPTSRFWTFQLIEAGLFLAASAAVIAIAVLVLRRRLA